MRNLLDLPTINNVTPGAHCVLNCPLGLTYDLIQFKLTNVTPADMLNFKVKAGSRTLIDVSSAKVLEDMNVYYSRDSQSGYFTLWFYRPELRPEARALTSMGTGDITSLTIEFDLDNGVTSPAISAHAVQRPQSLSGVVNKIFEYPTTYATSGPQQIDNIPRVDRITAIHLAKSDVSRAVFEINAGQGKSTVIEADKGLLEVMQKQHKRAPITAEYTHIDFNLLGEVAGPLPTNGLSDMRIRHTIDTSGALTAIVESLGGVVESN